jgi:hypothetical protein
MLNSRQLKADNFIRVGFEMNFIKEIIVLLMRYWRVTQKYVAEITSSEFSSVRRNKPGNRQLNLGLPSMSAYPYRISRNSNFNRHKKKKKKKKWKTKKKRLIYMEILLNSRKENEISNTPISGRTLHPNPLSL